MNPKLAVSLSLCALAPLAFALAPAALAQSKLTLTGTVVGATDDGGLWMRSYDRYYRVTGKAPFALTNGDRIRVAGAWDGTVLRGASWKSLSKVAALTANRSVAGAVYRDLPGDEFQVRSLGGAIYRVLALKGKPTNLNRPDLVRVYGRVSGGVMLAQSVLITAERTTLTAAPAYTPHRAVIGTIAANAPGNAFEISVGKERQRAVALYGDDSNLKVGQRVRMWAFRDATGLWQASNLRVLSAKTKGVGAGPDVNKTYGPKFRPKTIYGTVTAISGSQMTVRSNNGNSYDAQLAVARPALLAVGSQVRVDGYWSGGRMRVTAIVKQAG